MDSCVWVLHWDCHVHITLQPFPHLKVTIFASFAEDRRAYQTVHDVKVEIFASPHEAAHAAHCQRQSHEVRDVGAASCPPASPAPIGHGTFRLICEQFLLSISYWEHSRFLTGKPRTCSHPWIVGSAFWSKFLTSQSMLYFVCSVIYAFLAPLSWYCLPAIKTSRHRPVF